MSKKIEVLLMAFIALVVTAGCGGGGGNSDNTTPPAPTAKYTIMVYMVGSNLESGGGAATTDLNEMMAVGSTANMNVVVTTGGANKSGWTTVKRWLINAGSKTQLADLGNLNMGDSSSLRDFIAWTIATYPADKYALILWNHGGGTTGFGWDENSGDNLSVPELKQALANAHALTGKTFDVIGFDACLMATLEVAHNMSPFGKYLVSSEEIEPGHGWDYTPILQAIAGNPAISGSALGKVIADGYKTQAQANSTDKTITLSVVDLSKIPLIMSGLDSFAASANNNLQTFGTSAYITVADGRSRAEDYGNDQSKGYFTDMADLKNLAAALNASYTTETNELNSAITQAVVYKVNGVARPNANGLSIYLPYRGLEGTVDLTSYNNIDFSSTYKTMVANYVAAAQSDITVPTFTNETVNGSTYSANVQGNDIAEVYAFITQSIGTTVTILGMDSVAIGNNGLVSYTWTGQWLTLNNNYISVFTIGSEGTVQLLDIPALLNGQDVDVLVYLDTNSGQYFILGAWPGITNSGVPAKELLSIEASDVITPLFDSIDITTGAETMVQGNSFTAGSSLQLGITALPAGAYQLGFIGIDLSQNVGVSTFVTANAAPQFKAAKAMAETAPTQIDIDVAAKVMEKRRLK